MGEEMTPELVQALLTAFGPFGGLLAAGYILYRKASDAVENRLGSMVERIEAELHKMSEAVEGIRNDLQSHRDAVLSEQQAHRERLQRLEILADHMDRINNR